MAQKKRSAAELLQIKKQAKKLMLEHKLTQKEIAQKLGVSEKSMSAWAREYGWKVQAKQTLVMEGGNISMQHLTGFVDVQAFAAYLRQRDPSTYHKALGHLADYVVTLPSY